MYGRREEGAKGERGSGRVGGLGESGRGRVVVGERSLCSKLCRCVLIVEGHVCCILIYCMHGE